MSIPSGLVAFLFSDVEGSTRLWAADSDAMSASLKVHDEIMRAQIESFNGYIFTTAGDAFCAAFDKATDAVSAAIAAQKELSAASWPGPSLKVRMGLNLGEADERGGDYFGPTVNITARLEAVGHGGQVLISDSLHGGSGLDAVDLGVHPLKDVAEPVRIWQIGGGHFPDLRTISGGTNLPTPMTRLVGRDGDIRAVRTMLTNNRLVTLAATGGTGKTRLAIAVGDAELPHWRDGVWFVDLAKASDDSDVAPAIASALGLEIRGSNYVSEVARYVAGREVLLIIDNCEHLIDESADVLSEILAGGGTSAVLATSREWLDIDGEHVFQVHPLSVDDPEGAIRLFVDRATAVNPDFVLDDNNLSDVRELCRRVDGVPLAIELAAARSAVLSPADLVAGLEDRFRLLSGGRRRQRRRTLETTVDWSYDLLAPGEQRTFRALGVFAGSFDLHAAAAVCSASRAEITDLVEILVVRSLVMTAEDGTGRFRLLETLKAYAEDRLVDTGEALERRQLHADHFLDLVHIDDFDSALNGEQVTHLWDDRPNLALAADWFESAGRWDELAIVLSGVASFDPGDAALQTARITHCRSQVADPNLIDLLLSAENHLQMIAADWVGFIESARAMRQSGNDLIAARGYLVLAIPSGRQDPKTAYAVIDKAVARAGTTHADEVQRSAAKMQATVACFQTDIEAAVKHVQSATGQPVTRIFGRDMTATVLALDAWSKGDTHVMRQQIESLYDNDRPQDEHWASVFIGDLHALLAIAESAEDAWRVVERQALAAASGRWESTASGALGLIAILEAGMGNEDLARELILSTGSTRGPDDTFVVCTTARRLGIQDELARGYADHLLDMDWLIKRPAEALQRELDRRGWSEEKRR